MFDYSELVKLIRFKYDTQENLAKAAGMARSTLNLKLNNKVEFTQGEIRVIADLLGIEDDQITRYFFTQRVQNAEHSSV